MARIDLAEYHAIRVHIALRCVFSLALQVFWGKEERCALQSAFGLACSTFDVAESKIGNLCAETAIDLFGEEKCQDRCGGKSPWVLRFLLSRTYKDVPTR